jgi:aldehyde oxidoreductase
VVIQMVCDVTGLSPGFVVHDAADTFLAPDSGNTTASRQTVITGEATRKAAAQLKEALSGKTLADLEGTEYYAEFESVTDKMGSDKPHPVSHISYGYATQVCILGEDGKIKKFVAAHDVGRAINPRSVEGQIEGGVVMSMGYALTEDYPLKDCVPTAKFGTLGLFRANITPEIESIVIGDVKDGFAGGAKGIGEIAAIPGSSSHPARLLQQGWQIPHEATARRHSLFQKKVIRRTPEIRQPRPVRFLKCDGVWLLCIGMRIV